MQSDAEISPAGGRPHAVYYTRFEPDPWGNGGRRRAAQTLRLFEEWNPSIVQVAQGEPRWNYTDYLFARFLKRANPWTWELMRREWDTRGEYLRWTRNRRYYFWLLQSSAWHRATELRRSESQPALALIDDPVYFAPLVRELARLSVPVVGIVHNLETLSRWQVKPEHQHSLFRAEMDALGRCDMVVTISREETALLKRFGVNAVFHQYYPGPGVEKSLLAIREERQSSEKKDILMAGSTGNRASLLGMKAVAEAWEKYRLVETVGSLRIAGFGTEELRELVGRPLRGVDILGSLSQDKLDAELASTKACLCYQTDSSGALTRIMELLMADVPVVGNSLACRTYHGRDGVTEFDSLRDIRPTLEGLSEESADIAVPWKPNGAPVLRRIRNILEAKSAD